MILTYRSSIKNKFIDRVAYEGTDRTTPLSGAYQNYNRAITEQSNYWDIFMGHEVILYALELAAPPSGEKRYNQTIILFLTKFRRKA